MAANAPQLASAAMMVREDGQLLIVHHSAFDPEFPGLWSLPMQPLADDDVAEDSIADMLRERFHVRAGPVEFAETIYIEGSRGARYILNVFTCHGWSGEPRFAEGDYDDVAWIAPGGQGAVDLVPGVDAWLETAFQGGAPLADPVSIADVLTAAREQFLAAYDAIPASKRGTAASGGWSALDVLAHNTSVETYYAAETRRMLEVPGHTWRQYNERQWEDDHRARPAEPEADVRARLEALRAETMRWVTSLATDQLEAYGNHPERGVVTVIDRIRKIAEHDREHAAQLTSMLGTLDPELFASRSTGAGTGEADAATAR
ncbi:MAG TPA: DinB family protein [Dehalococcoidia bacterium]|nr:DinB family protein [Dehalococcoidia bacterium]